MLGGCASEPAATPSAHAQAAPAVAPSGSWSDLAETAWNGAGERRFTAMGEQAGSLAVRREGDNAGVRVFERVEMEGSAPAERESVLGRDADGNVVLVQEVNHEEKVVVDFEPPLVIYPASIGAGESREQKVHMTVHPMRDTTRVQAQGDVKHTIRWDGSEEIQTPAGKVEAKKLVSVFEADLGGPQVRNETQEWIAPGRGVVARKKMERTTMLGLKVRSKSEWWVAQ